jgi:hypothetical protein
MVEGPGCTLNGEKLQPCVGQRLLRVLPPSSNPTSHTRNVNTSAARGVGPESWSLLVGIFVCAVRTLGKELFIFFAKNVSDEVELNEEAGQDCEFCLRVHFGMSGRHPQLSGRRGSLEGAEAQKPNCATHQ